MKIFVMGLPHTKTSVDFTTCAFTMKAWNLCRMMKRRGHEVIHLGTEGSNPECSEHVSVTPHDAWEKLYGHPGANFYNLETEGKYRPYMDLYARNAKKAILERCNSTWDAIVAVPWGGAQREAIQGVDQFAVESGIGYRHTWSKYRVFESYAWMHFHLGLEKKFEGNAWYDVVIPNAFDTEMFGPAVTEKIERSPDFLYIGRLNDDKGVGLAIHIAKVAGRGITIVGQGNPDRFLKDNPHVKYIPPVGVEARRELMRKAHAILCPSFYVEPFCGVNVEAQMSGTPVITTDWGVFNETVQHGYTGWRCRNFEQFVWAAKNVDKLAPREKIREWAVNNYSLERIAPMYEEYFQMVLNLKSQVGWYLENPDRFNLDWMQRSYPGMEAAPNTKRHHVVPVIPDEWVEAQQWESNWWGLEPAPHWEEEKRKQETYFRMMDFPKDKDFGEKTILDVGCGPCSVLLRSKHGPSRGIDPLLMSKETKLDYARNGIELLNIPAEEMPLDKVFDEAWMYNCLQHTKNPHLILQKLAQCAKTIRIMEFIDLGKCPGHPQVLTEDMFKRVFWNNEWKRVVWNVGWLRGFGSNVEDKYIALVLEKIG